MQWWGVLLCMVSAVAAIVLPVCAMRALPPLLNLVPGFGDRADMPTAPIHSKKGASRRQLQRLKTSYYKQGPGEAADPEDPAACPICSCDYVPLALVTTLPCGHYFHNECICKWLNQDAVCPMCRSEITNSWSHWQRIKLPPIKLPTIRHVIRTDRKQQWWFELRNMLCKSPTAAADITTTATAAPAAAAASAASAAAAGIVSEPLSCVAVTPPESAPAVPAATPDTPAPAPAPSIVAP